MDMSNELLASIIAKNGQWIADMANSLRTSQWASAASVARNEKEQAEYAKIAQSAQYEFGQNGAGVSLKESEFDVSPFKEIIEEGMGTPYSGGQGGTVTEPDGSTHSSNVPSQLWGTPLPWYAKEANPVSEGIITMLKSLVPSWVRETAADSKSEIAEVLKEDILKELSSILAS